MFVKRLPFYLMSWLLVSCGGGGDPVAPDRTAPVISDIALSPVTGGQITLTALASDQRGVTGYCFRTSTVAPQASDPCFGPSNSTLIAAPATLTTYFAWARDASGNVSASFQKAVPDAIRPVVAAVDVTTVSGGEVTLVATPSDEADIAEYCFKSTDVQPEPSDPCFARGRAQSIAAPAMPMDYFVWAKDTSGNVSEAFQRSLSDAVAPVITTFSVSPPSNGQVTLTANASDAMGVAGYCFTTSATAPDPNDACFTGNTSGNLPEYATPTLYYVWAKDLEGNINARSGGSTLGCSATGLAASQSSALPTVCVSTSLGEFVVELESAKAPITTTNFLKYVNDGFYSDTVFHRVISNFMVQGGGFTGVPIGPATTPSGTVYPAIALETTEITGLSNTTGTIAMARTSALNSATTQFFVNVVDNTFLNTSGGGYAAFGRVISGMDTTIQAIRGVAVQGATPLNPPVIHWAYQLK